MIEEKFNFSKKQIENKLINIETLPQRISELKSVTKYGAFNYTQDEEELFDEIDDFYEEFDDDFLDDDKEKDNLIIEETKDLSEENQKQILERFKEREKQRLAGYTKKEASKEIGIYKIEFSEIDNLLFVENFARIFLDRFCPLWDEYPILIFYYENIERIVTYKSTKNTIRFNFSQKIDYNNYSNEINNFIKLINEHLESLPNRALFYDFFTSEVRKIANPIEINNYNPDYSEWEKEITYCDDFFNLIHIPKEQILDKKIELHEYFTDNEIKIWQIKNIIYKANGILKIFLVSINDLDASSDIHKMSKKIALKHSSCLIIFQLYNTIKISFVMCKPNKTKPNFQIQQIEVTHFIFNDFITPETRDLFIAINNYLSQENIDLFPLLYEFTNNRYSYISEKQLNNQIENKYLGSLDIPEIKIFIKENSIKNLVSSCDFNDKEYKYERKSVQRAYYLIKKKYEKL